MANLIDCPFCGGIHVKVPVDNGVYYSYCRDDCGKIKIVVSTGNDGKKQVEVTRASLSGLQKSLLFVFVPFALITIFVNLIEPFKNKIIKDYPIMTSISIPVFFLLIVILIPFIIGYNKLARLLNEISKRKSSVVAILARRGIAITDLERLSGNVAEFEKETHKNVASARGTGINNPFLLGSFSIESPPDLKAIRAFLKTQENIESFENKFLSAWSSWAESAQDYEDYRSTFPLIIVAWISNILKHNRFPSVLDRQSENDYNPQTS